MTIMGCPKCGGGGEVWIDVGEYSTIAPYKTTCPSCGGLGYVTDNQPSPNNPTPERREER